MAEDQSSTIEGLDVGGAAVAEPPAQPQPMAQPAKPDKGGFVWGTGRRKSAIARARVKPGDGKFLVNGRELDNFFSEPQHREQAISALRVTKTEGQLDVHVKVQGGGITGQAGAVLLGVARAIKGYDPSLEGLLREQGYLTRDPREVERKKYGQAGARRRFQFSKR